MRTTTGVLLAAIVVIAGCGDDGDTSAAEAGSTTVASTEVTTTTTSPEMSTTTEPAPADEGGGTAVDLPVELEVIEDVPYTSERSLDIYAPVDGSDLPVIVYFHGGLPAEGQRAADAARLRSIAEQGIVVYAPDWRSIGPAGGSQDSVCAIAYAETTADDHRGDGEAITLSGYSTGGFTALVHGLLGSETPLAVTDCLVDPVVHPALAVAAGGVPVFAAEWARDGRLPSPAWTALGPEELDRFDPYLLIGTNPDVTVALAVGDDDQGGVGAPPGGWPITDSVVDFHDRLVAAGYDATLTTFPGGHDFAAGSEQEQTFVDMIVDVATASG